MITRRTTLAAGAAGAASAVWLWMTRGAPATAAERFDVSMSDAEWKTRLTPAQYAVLRKDGTERPFSSALLHEERSGTFTCAGCEHDLFASKTKFDSGTGWPSFWAPLDEGVGTVSDRSWGMARTAVHCARCGGHLGHVFDDGPKPTGQRYCMNGVAMAFRPVAA